MIANTLINFGGVFMLRINKSNYNLVCGGGKSKSRKLYEFSNFYRKKFTPFVGCHYKVFQASFKDLSKKEIDRLFDVNEKGIITGLKNWDIPTLFSAFSMLHEDRRIG